MSLAELTLSRFETPVGWVRDAAGGKHELRF